MILSQENKILRTIAKPVTDAKSKKLADLIKKMAEAMFKEPDGIGIAAPQIGESHRIFLVARDVLRLDEGIDLTDPKKRGKDYLVFINPSLKKTSTKKTKDIEGCLSVRDIYGEVMRPEKVTIEYTDEEDRKQMRGASGLFARVLQHELDHLEGVLFIDKAKDIRKIDHNGK